MLFRATKSDDCHQVLPLKGAGVASHPHIHRSEGTWPHGLGFFVQIPALWKIRYRQMSASRIFRCDRAVIEARCITNSFNLIILDRNDVELK
jgi:hypothetical protein